LGTGVFEIVLNASTKKLFFEHKTIGYLLFYPFPLDEGKPQSFRLDKKIS
jgi:hypothetical protein